MRGIGLEVPDIVSTFVSRLEVLLGLAELVVEVRKVDLRTYLEEILVR